MRKTLVLVLVMIFFAALAACRTIFHADFNTDIVGEIPSSMPAGNPPDDRLVSQGSKGGVIVIQSDLISSKAVSLDRMSAPPATVLTAYPVNGPHIKGTYSISFKAYGLADESGLSICVLSKSERKAFAMVYRSGFYTLSSGNGNGRLPGTYSPGTVHDLMFKIDMTRKRFSLAINGNTLASDHRFLEVGCEDLAMIQFKYSEAILEAFPGRYVIDDLTIKKRLW